MGVKLFDLVDQKPITIKDLRGKKIAADASLFLHQFLTSIRQPDGTPLTNSKGAITSHLVGLFSRTAKLLSEGVQVCYVFDGTPPALKDAEIKRRSQLKEEARALYKKSSESGDIASLKKYASRTVALTPQLVNEAKELLEAMGVPVIQAPSEAEAQAAAMTHDGTVWAVASQDGDCLLFGAKRQVRNLAIAGRKKKAGTLSTQTIQPELIELETVLRQNELTQRQLIALGVLVGTDFDIGGIPGIGPQKARKLIAEYKDDLDSLFRKVEWEKHFTVPWKHVMDIFTDLPVHKNVQLQWRSPDPRRIRHYLVDTFEFSQERVESTLQMMQVAQKTSAQKGLGDFA